MVKEGNSKTLPWRSRCWGSSSVDILIEAIVVVDERRRRRFQGQIFSLSWTQRFIFLNAGLIETRLNR